MTTTLIAGGTGKTGRRVAEQLTTLNHPIKIGSRPGPHPFDWNDESTWKHAEVVATVLTEDGHVEQLYELTGSRLLTFAEAVHEIGDATGRTISFEQVAGMPLQEAHSLAELFTEVLDGHNAHQSDGVRRALGREPRGFGDYVRRTAQTGVWGG